MATDLTKKKILVTGGAGFVGRHLVKNLVEKRGIPRKNIFIPRSSELDLKIKKDAEKAVKGQDIVFHLAALSGGIGFSRANPGRMFYDNAIMALNIIEASKLRGLEKFINIGSYNEYPEKAQIPLSEESLWDGLPEFSLRPYGMAKKMALMQLQTYRQESGFNGIHLIMASMYGPGYDQNSTNLIPLLINQINDAKKNNTPIIGWGTGRATRDFLYVEDAVEGIILAAENYNKAEPLNLGGGKEVPVKELIETLCELMDFRGELKWDSSKPEGQLRYVMNISRASQEIGYKPMTDLKQGLKKTLIQS